jgi:hypothetical protein
VPDGSNARPSAPCSEDDTAHRLAYERLRDESNRLRGARQFFARQLGPLPAFAGISLAVVGAFSDKIQDEAWLAVALGLFALMVLTSIAYSRMPAYRELRTDRLRTMGEGLQADAPAAWYRAEHQLEASIYASRRRRSLFWRLPYRDLDSDMQEQMDKERFGVFVVQVLFLLVVASLLLAR